MSVLIRGMKMPENCYKCPLRRRNGMDIVCPVEHERFSVADVNILEYRLDNCPLVHVPPHGRLIDADVFIKRMEGLVHRAEADGCDFGAAWYTAFIRHIELAPTIIEAEEGE